MNRPWTKKDWVLESYQKQGDLTMLRDVLVLVTKMDFTLMYKYFMTV